MILNDKDYEQYKKIIKTRKIIRFSKIFLSLIILSFAIVLVYNFDLDFNNTVNTNNNIYGDSGPECSNLSFQNTTICLNDYVRAMPFIYNVTDDEIDLTLDDLKRRGGDCRDWTNFYESYLNYYGYNQTQRVKVFVEDEGDSSIYHVFLIASHHSGYCHIDMTDLQCYQYINDRGEVRD